MATRSPKLAEKKVCWITLFSLTKISRKNSAYHTEHHVQNLLIQPNPKHD